MRINRLSLFASLAILTAIFLDPSTIRFTAYFAKQAIYSTAQLITIPDYSEITKPANAGERIKFYQDTVENLLG